MSKFISKLIDTILMNYNQNNYGKQNPWGNYQNQYSNQNNPSNYPGNNNNNYNPYGYGNSDAPYQNMNNYNPTPYGNNSQNFGAEEYTRKSSSKLIDLEMSARVGFIRKVYTILSIQLLATAVMCYISMSSLSFFTFQLQNTWLLFVALIVAIGIQIYMFCCNGGRSFPQDWICVSIFTLCEAYMVSFICSVTGMQSGNQIVFLAALMTFGTILFNEVIVFALTVYAILTPQDFTASCGIVVVLSVVLLILFIVTLFTDNKVITMIYCAVGVFLFGVYLIIDTQMIIGGKTIQLGIDEYCLGAMLLYIDIIQIFLYILEFLRSANSE